METILSLIQKYKAGDAHASEEICNRMTPLIKKYASKIHCMEFEDAMQELYITLLETLPHLTPSKPEAQCLKYITTAVHNRYRSLCKTYPTPDIPFINAGFRNSDSQRTCSCSSMVSRQSVFF